MAMSEEEFVNKKEMISAMIFDYETDSLPDHSGLHEEACNDLAEQILNALGFYPTVVDFDKDLYGKCEKCNRVHHIDGLRKIGIKRIYGTDYDRFECVSKCKED